MSVRKKVVKTVDVKVCDSCDKEIADGQAKPYSVSELCPTCYGTPPPWALRYQHEIWTAICNEGFQRSAPIPLTVLAEGIWMLYEGREDAGMIHKLRTIEEARKRLMENTQAGSDGGRAELVDVFQDGKALGAEIVMTVVFRNPPTPEKGPTVTPELKKLFEAEINKKFGIDRLAEATLDEAENTLLQLKAEALEQLVGSTIARPLLEQQLSMLVEHYGKHHSLRELIA